MLKWKINECRKKGELFDFLLLLLHCEGLPFHLPGASQVLDSEPDLEYPELQEIVSTVL